MPEQPENRVEYFNKRFSGMDIERESFVDHWRELQEFVSPRRGRFMVEDRTRGRKRHQSIINSKATQALRVAVAGMLNGTMSPSRPWFKLETFDPDLMESEAVRQWLHKAELIVRSILNESNFYNMAPVFLKELLLFGTSAMTHVDDFEDVARFYTHTAGSYYIAQNDRLEVDVIAREFEWPCVQIVKMFGAENVSEHVKLAWDRGNYNNYFRIRHFIEPNADYKRDSKLSVDKQYISVYWEPSNRGVDKDKILRVSGFDTFPAYTTRWDITEGDIWAVDCPGMTALGDVKQLQTEEKRKAQAIDKMVNPPLSGPPNIKNVPVSSLPGGLTIFEGDNQKQKLEPIYQVEPRLQELRLDMDAVERRIDNAFFVDLFLAISNMQGIQPRNQLDLSQRNEERLVQLGPVLERLHGEFLSPMIDRVFAQASAADIFPDAPEELQDSSLRIRFISSLAMAQRSIVVSDIERLTGFGASLAAGGWPGALDKFNPEQAMDVYAQAIGVPPSVIISDEEVEAKRQAQAQEAARQSQANQLEQGVDIAQAASEVNPENIEGIAELAQQGGLG